jgi:phosphoribosyl 1,2-cyclic phosphate phosphodiesterase
LLRFTQVTEFSSFTIGNLQLTPLPLVHSKCTFGYFIEDGRGASFAYLTDTVGLPKETEAFLQGKAFDMVIDCSHPPQSTTRNHNDLTQALHIIDRTAPRHAWLTHISHGMDVWLLSHEASLPSNVSVARDGGNADLTPRA